MFRKRFWVEFTDFTDWIPQRQRVRARRQKDAVKIIRQMFGDVAILSVEVE